LGPEIVIIIIFSGIAVWFNKNGVWLTLKIYFHKVIAGFQFFREEVFNSFVAET